MVSYLLGEVGVREEVSEELAGVRWGGVAVRGPPGWSNPVRETGSSKSSSSSENEISGMELIIILNSFIKVCEMRVS